MSLKDIKKFDDAIFREFYNKLMAGERNVAVIAGGEYSKPDSVMINYLKLDFQEAKPSCLDVGCANGYLLLKMRNDGLISDSIGIDISDIMIEYAKTSNVICEPNIDFFRTGFEEFNTEQTFDVLIMDEILEHFVEPDQMLEKAYNLLNIDGFLYGTIPNDLECDCEAHLNHYNINTLYRLLLTKFKRITIIPIDLYEGFNKQEIHLWFRCQKGDLYG